MTANKKLFVFNILLSEIWRIMKNMKSLYLNTGHIFHDSEKEGPQWARTKHLAYQYQYLTSVSSGTRHL